VPIDREVNLLFFIKWFFGVLIVLICIIPLLTVNVRITFIKGQPGDEFIVIFSFLTGLVNIRVETNRIKVLILSMIKSMMDEETGLADGWMSAAGLGSELGYKGAKGIIEESLRRYRLFKPAFNYFISRMVIKDIVWETSMGWGDAAVTGITTGLLWNMKTVILNFLNACMRRVVIKKININPDFNNISLSVYFDCILSFKIGHAIVAGAGGIFARLKEGENFERAPN
jgi:hypothetical protein